MRFLIDRCAGRRLADFLLGLGHDVVESRSLGMDPGDETLLRWAEQNRRILVTLDTDFGRLVYLKKASHSGIVRLPDVPAQKRIEIMKLVLQQYEKDLEAGAIVTVRSNRIHISKPSA